MKQSYPELHAGLQGSPGRLHTNLHWLPAEQAAVADDKPGAGRNLSSPAAHKR